jgi:cell division septum initiation protein DivIVA
MYAVCNLSLTKNGAITVTYHDQPYYKEFRDLLTRIQAGVNDLKEENQRLKEENHTFSNQLKEVRGMLADAQREVDRLQTGQTDTSGKLREHDTASRGPASDGTGRPSQTLFDSLDENEKRILRQQIIDMIARIDRHLDQSGTSATAEP